MFGVPTIEERIQRSADYIEERKSHLEHALADRANLVDSLARVDKNIETWVGLINESKSRVGELTLLKDVRDGKLIVLNLETMEPASIAFV